MGGKDKAMAKKPNQYDRYIAVARRLQARYSVNGALVVSVGGKPSRYARLEQMAFWRYAMGYSRLMVFVMLAKTQARTQELLEAA
jgi:hypothetical protein